MKLLFYGFRHGHINGFYKKALQHPDVEIVACAEEDADARRAAQKALDVSFSSESYESLLRSDADAVVIGKAYGDRGAAIIAALEAGKHVISDKPICTTLEELEKIRELSTKRALCVCCMLDLRYLPQSIEAGRILRSGELGRVCNVSFNGQHYLDPENRPRWYYENGMHGGTVNDLAIHGIDLVRELTGLGFSRIDAARTWNCYATEHKSFRDSAIFMARLDGGAGVLADVSYSAPKSAFSMPSYWEFRFWCERGMLTFNYVSDTVTVYRDSAEAEVISCTSAPDCLDDFISVIGDKNYISTLSVIDSTRTALEIQHVADLCI